MSLARLVVTAVRIEGRTKAEVSRDYGVSPRWVYELCRRFDAEGEAGLEPRSRRPRGSPRQTPGPGRGRDRRAPQGAHRPGPGRRRPHDRLPPRAASRRALPSVATIWRILSRRGFVTPQPQKRPRSSFIRFEADMPNERWQADITHWRLADETEVEILNVIDDHSRFLVASDARVVFKAADVVATLPSSRCDPRVPGVELLTDNGAVFTAAPRKGRCAIELETAAAGDPLRALQPLPPADLRQGGAVPPDAKRFLAKQEPAATLARAAGQARSVPRLLQRRPPAPGDRAANPGRSLRRPTEGHTDGSRGRWSLPTSGSARTRSTSPGRSRFVTTPGCTTSGSGGGSSAPGCSCSSPISTSGCSPKTES